MKGSISQCQSISDANDLTELTIKIPTGLLRQLTDAAALVETDVQSLIACYAKQGIENTSTGLKLQHFLTHTKDVLEKHGVQDITVHEILSKFLY